LLLNLEALLTIVLAVAAFGDRLRQHEVAGAVIILTGAVARSQRFRRKRREEKPWSNPRALVLAALPFVVMAALLVVFLMRHEQFMSERGRLPFAVTPWDASWPALPVANIAGALRDEVARALYAFAGRREDVLRYIPCYWLGSLLTPSRATIRRHVTVIGGPPDYSL
jgi:drug/metabolite transporter (DMT)-like permease